MGYDIENGLVIFHSFSRNLFLAGNLSFLFPFCWVVFGPAPGYSAQQAFSQGSELAAVLHEAHRLAACAT
jgi:hypothetical protein